MKKYSNTDIERILQKNSQYEKEIKKYKKKIKSDEYWINQKDRVISGYENRKVIKLLDKFTKKSNVKKMPMQKTENSVSAVSQSEIHFSVITTAYNSGKYLDEYFQSVFQNDFDFNKLELLIIDDGSTDDTKNVIDRWKKKFPSIKYIYQENSGQSSARNLAMKSMVGDWVLFIDSDDFIDSKYFKNIEEAIIQTNGNSIISPNIIYYREEENEISNSHPLKYRYDNKEKFFTRSFINDPKCIQMSACAAYSVDVIKKYNLQFREIKPYFEDGYFNLEYVLKSNNFNVTFCKDAKYYYRKRADKSSTIDMSQTDPTRYTDLLKNAYISILKMYNEELGFVPSSVATTVLYDISWNIKAVLNDGLIFSDEDNEKREEYLKEIFSYIDFTIITDNWRWMWKKFQIGINYRYYDNSHPTKAGAYYSYTTGDFHIIDLYSCDDNWTIEVDGIAKGLDQTEHTSYDEFMSGKLFTKRFFVKIPINARDVKVYHLAKEQKIANSNLMKPKSSTFTSESVCLFFDRNDRADDNAEALYDWFLENKSEFENLYFAISIKSPDYMRLMQKGFKVVNYGSLDFKNLYLNADYIFSSALDAEIENFDGLRHSFQKTSGQFIFLQHGVILNDLRKWFNTKKIDGVIATSAIEYRNFTSNYLLFDEQIIPTGLPRYDKLKNASSLENVILFQPTWRKHLQNVDVSEFVSSDYYKSIVSVFQNEKLNKKLRENKFILKFIPHPEMNIFYDEFVKFQSETVKIADVNKISYSEEFKVAKLMITDYSSVFNDFSYLRKPVIFYQFDDEQFFANHLWDRHFDYEKNGLGDTFKQETEMIDSLIENIENDCTLSALYADRIEDYFLNSDGNNCQKLFDHLSRRPQNYYMSSSKNVFDIKIQKSEYDTFNLMGFVEIFVDGKFLYKFDATCCESTYFIDNIVVPKALLCNHSHKISVYNNTNGYVYLESTPKVNLPINKKVGLEIMKIQNVKSLDDVIKLYVSEFGDTLKPANISVIFDSNAGIENDMLLSIVPNDSLILRFHDMYFVKGTFFKSDDFGNKLEDSIAEFIESRCAKFNLTTEGMKVYTHESTFEIANSIKTFFNANEVYDICQNICCEDNSDVCYENAVKTFLENNNIE
jgi:CDP-ribitol ribitolphosphotransferase